MKPATAAPIVTAPTAVRTNHLIRVASLSAIGVLRASIFSSRRCSVASRSGLVADGESMSSASAPTCSAEKPTD
jgi:hypothetical protein